MIIIKIQINKKYLKYFYLFYSNYGNKHIFYISFIKIDS